MGDFAVVKYDITSFAKGEGENGEVRRYADLSVVAPELIGEFDSIVDAQARAEELNAAENEHIEIDLINGQKYIGNRYVYRVADAR